MKHNYMRGFVEKQLAKQAKKLIRKKKPFIIGVTGSVGKSSAKKCIGTVLRPGFNVLVSPKNYNTEFGLPLAILGLESGGKSPVKWLKNLLVGWKRASFPAADYPDTLVLEMAADHPGDIKKLVQIAPPDVAVVTAVGESHLQFFGSREEIAKEKAELVRAVSADGLVVLNRDDKLVWEMRNKAEARVVSFGFHDQAEIRALPESVQLACHGQEGCGTSFKVTVNGSNVPLFVSESLGWPTIYSVLVSMAVGQERGLNILQVSDRIKDFIPVPGRLRYIPGIKETAIIDDSYNAAPKSTLAALEVLNEMPLQAEDDKRFAVLGDMLELGSVSEEAHREVGRCAAELKVDYLVLVGELMNEAKKAAVEAGFPEDQVMHFAGTEDAGRFVQGKMKRGDVILVKGSRSMKMEYVVKELMAEPLRAAQLLPGDHEEWEV